ncbi:hypothetical protein BLNAU_8793 [Blattamonas nauphoetae]|uniref:TFIIE beta domain-containing protein n=1 Tax=Blattamonas nauphoetae TaxID=2049346 RepID=A0ABQ9XXL8_9EUKA|nr:hypothetical protein BLNAU_8793 [Blattamonas nauphoetae]
MQRNSDSLNKEPIGLYLYKLITFLRADRKVHSITEVAKQLDMPITQNESLYNSIRVNPKIDFNPDSNEISFRPAIRASNIDELMRALFEHPKGLSMDLVDESYGQAWEDMSKLVANRQAFFAVNEDIDKPFVEFPTRAIKKEYYPISAIIVFPNMAPDLQAASEAHRMLWSRVPIQSPATLITELVKWNKISFLKEKELISAEEGRKPKPKRKGKLQPH